jgi:SsrA-binding protein
MTDISIRNRRARHDYDILETLEVGLVLVGSEIKSIRDGKAGLAGAYASFDDSGQLWVIGMHVAEYPQARDNHAPLRRRKLLAHSRELQRLRRKVDEKGLTLIPLDIHFTSGVAKIQLGLCKGRRAWDKREEIARREENRRIESTMKSRRE